MTRRLTAYRAFGVQAALAAAGAALAAGCNCGPLRALEEYACTDDSTCTGDRVCLEAVSGRTYCALLPCTQDADCARIAEACQAGACDLATSLCASAPRNDGASCDDGLYCTTPDSCQMGTCTGDARRCGATGCDLGCDEVADACGGPPPPDGSPCSDADFCTVGEACAANACAGGTPRDCTALDGACTVGACDSAGAACVAMSRAEGLDCADGQWCNGPDFCQGGVCVSGPSPCAPGPCFGGECDEMLALCTPLADGTACDDGDVCTMSTTCATGLCGGGVLADGDADLFSPCAPADPDCDDANAAVHPGAEESLALGNCTDGLDNDCDATPDAVDAGCLCPTGCAACAIGGCCSESAPSGCLTCLFGCICDLICTGNSCNGTCEAGAVCTLGCAGTNGCTLYCVPGASCTCTSANCTIDSSGATC